jgi:hypothetical protein
MPHTRGAPLPWHATPSASEIPFNGGLTVANGLENSAIRRLAYSFSPWHGSGIDFDTRRNPLLNSGGRVY